MPGVDQVCHETHVGDTGSETPRTRADLTDEAGAAGLPSRPGGAVSLSVCHRSLSQLCAVPKTPARRPASPGTRPRAEPGMSSQLPPRLIGRYAGVPLGAGGGRRILTYSLGGRVCADWASLGLWGSLSLIFTLLAFLWLCGWGTWLLSAILCAPKCSGGWGEGRQTSGISPQSGGSVATSWEEAMGCPQFLAGSYLPTLAGAWGVDLRGGGATWHSANRGFPGPRGTRFQAAPVPAPVCPFVSLLWPLRPWGGGAAFTHGLRVRPEAAGRTRQD